MRMTSFQRPKDGQRQGPRLGALISQTNCLQSTDVKPLESCDHRPNNGQQSRQLPMKTASQSTDAQRIVACPQFSWVMTKQRRANGDDIPADYDAKTHSYKRKQR
jgi:hypothetical protein